MSERLVGVPAVTWTHAVLVPHDLTPPRDDVIFRPGRGGLVLSGRWSGQAECGQVVRGIVAGPAHGHDWDTVPSRDQCPRCLRAIASG